MFTCVRTYVCVIVCIHVHFVAFFLFRIYAIVILRRNLLSSESYLDLNFTNKKVNIL